MKKAHHSAATSPKQMERGHEHTFSRTSVSQCNIPFIPFFWSPNPCLSALGTWGGQRGMVWDSCRGAGSTAEIPSSPKAGQPDHRDACGDHRSLSRAPSRGSECVQRAAPHTRTTAGGELQPRDQIPNQAFLPLYKRAEHWGLALLNASGILGSTCPLKS